MASPALQDSMDTKALPDATDLKRALVDILYRRQFGALLIFGIDPLNRTPGNNIGQALKVLNSIVIPAPESFHITDDKIAVLFDADDARVPEIPSSLPAVIAEQTGHRVSCGGVKISSEDYGLHPQMSEMIFSTAQCVLARAQQHTIPHVVWLTEKSAEDILYLTDISLNFFREIARINAARVQRMTLESRTDFLTGLYNRRGFEAVFTRMVRRSNLNGNPLALYYIDSDSLKAINDSKGHDAGDRFIVDLAQVLNDMLRGSDLLSRWAGDEFAAVVENTPRARAYAIARRLNRAVDERTEGTISIGVYHGVPKSMEDAFQKSRCCPLPRKKPW